LRIRRIDQSRRLDELATFDITAHSLRLRGRDARCGRPILIDSRCLAAISRYTALRPTLSMSVASAAVAMSGSVIMFLSCLIRFLRRRGSGFSFRLLSGSKVVSRCTNREQ
jgi:hypothetical protein